MQSPDGRGGRGDLEPWTALTSLAQFSSRPTQERRGSTSLLTARRAGQMAGPPRGIVHCRGRRDPSAPGGLFNHGFLTKPVSSIIGSPLGKGEVVRHLAVVLRERDGKAPDVDAVWMARREIVEQAEAEAEQVLRAARHSSMILSGGRDPARKQRLQAECFGAGSKGCLSTSSDCQAT
jgi:hypothetical protein